MIPALLLSFLLVRPTPPQTSPALAASIARLFHDVMTANDDATPVAEATQIYAAGCPRSRKSATKPPMNLP